MTDSIKSQFERIAALKSGWDGYRGEPIKPEIINLAQATLEKLMYDGIPVPSIVAGSNGGVQIEWHTHDYDVEIEIVPPDDILVFVRDCRTGNQFELKVLKD